MSTTRPLRGRSRGTELACPEQPASGPPPPEPRPPEPRPPEARPPEAATVDEFAVLEDKEDELKCARRRVEDVFRVAFTIIGLLDHGGLGGRTARQIWLQLRGGREDVSKAKEYVRGLCDPELQEQEQYPVDMHCIFAGARGLFLDRLIRDTSAEVLVLEPGCLRLLGRAEPVVMAQSRVQQFVALFQEKRSLPPERETAVKRAFKAFVEERDDKYAMELLLLPSGLKEELLGLAHSPAAAVQPNPALPEGEQDRSQSSTPVTDLSNRILGTTFEDRGSGSGPDGALLNGTRPSHKRRSSESETRDTKRQFSLERREESPDRGRENSGRSKTPSASFHLPSRTVATATTQESGENGSEEGEVSPETNLRCLVNFFRTMGYEQELVERVVKETGPTEDTFLILEKIVSETKRCEHASKKREKEQRLDSVSSSDLLSSSSSTSTSLTVPRDKELSRFLMESNKWKVSPSTSLGKGSSNGLGHRRQCSGSVTSTQQAITIKRSSSAQGGAGDYDVITIDDDDDDDDIILVANPCTGSRGAAAPADLPSRTDCLARGGASPRDYLSRGGAQTLGGTAKVESVMALRSAPQWLAAAAPGASHVTCPLPAPRSTASYQTVGHAGLQDKDVGQVTGLARFQQSLKTPFTLKLPNEPGRPDLRHVIIDGSNVAMAHGLHRFFSCRGIALAVEMFWRRGHREVTVFVPQWRQKRDRFTLEQHFLTQLEDLRLLSFTPSREVCGQRIASHDDRFLLHLAEKTDGVIVTNDNLKDFVRTSDAWRRIIQERLLQFTFVEDLFMIPDDPLGKNGPHLDTFLRRPSMPPPLTPPPPRPPDFRPSAQPPLYVKALYSAPAHWPAPPGPRRSPSPSPSPPPPRSPVETSELKRKLYDIFPDQKQRIDGILQENPYMRDLNALSGLLLGS